MTQVTFWVWQLDALSAFSPADIKSYKDLAEKVAGLVPQRYTAGLCIKSHWGVDWIGSSDRHPLAIRDASNLEACANACSEVGVAFSSWGEARGNTAQAAALATKSSEYGYHVLDVEPYAEFKLPTVHTAGELVAARHPRSFWKNVREIDPDREYGISLVPQASGLDPFGDFGMYFWLEGASWVHLQCYETDAPRLHWKLSVPYYLDYIQRNLLPGKRVIPIIPFATYREHLPQMHYQYVDVWRL